MSECAATVALKARADYPGTERAPSLRRTGRHHFVGRLQAERPASRVVRIAGHEMNESSPIHRSAICWNRRRNFRSARLRSPAAKQPWRTHFFRRSGRVRKMPLRSGWVITAAAGKLNLCNVWSIAGGWKLAELQKQELIAG